MNGDVPQRHELFPDVFASGDVGPVSLLLEASEEEFRALERLYAATEHVRKPGATREQKDEAIERLLSEDASLRNDLRTVTGREHLLKSG
jgi:hypothetical protein